MFSVIASILAPVFISVCIGFFWVRRGHPYDTELITSLVTYFGTPCLLFYSNSPARLQVWLFYNIQCLRLSSVISLPRYMTSAT